MRGRLLTPCLNHWQAFGLPLPVCTAFLLNCFFTQRQRENCASPNALGLPRAGNEHRKRQLKCLQELNNWILYKCNKKGNRCRGPRFKAEKQTLVYTVAFVAAGENTFAFDPRAPMRPILPLTLTHRDVLRLEKSA